MASHAAPQGHLGAERSPWKTIVVNPCQKGNPVLDLIRNVAWTYGEVVPDFVVGKGAAVLFLSLRYHKLHPNYIYDRLKGLDGRDSSAHNLRIVLFLVDAPDHVRSIRELSRISATALNFTLVLSWSNEEAARYLETFKAFERKTADSIKARVGDTHLERMTAALCNIRSVNKSDALTLSLHFKSFADVLRADEQSLALCPGFGKGKTGRFLEAMECTFDPRTFKGSNCSL